jgi:hypothetical protein
MLNYANITLKVKQIQHLEQDKRCKSHDMQSSCAFLTNYVKIHKKSRRVQRLTTNVVIHLDWVHFSTFCAFSDIDRVSMSHFLDIVTIALTSSIRN